VSTFVAWVLILWANNLEGPPPTARAQQYESESDDNDDSETDYASSNKKSAVPSLVSQSELNDFVRNLGLPKDGT